jgi:hypothetical protein
MYVIRKGCLVTSISRLRDQKKHVYRSKNACAWCQLEYNKLSLVHEKKNSV